MLVRLVLRSLVAAAVLGLRFSGATHAEEQTQAAGCPVSVPESIGVDCGELIVPENYDEPEGRQLRLPYIILQSRSEQPEPDPVVFTAGGPGYSSLDSVWCQPTPTSENCWRRPTPPLQASCSSEASHTTWRISSN